MCTPSRFQMLPSLHVCQIKQYHKKKTITVFVNVADINNFESHKCGGSVTVCQVVKMSSSFANVLFEKPLEPQRKWTKRDYELRGDSY